MMFARSATHATPARRLRRLGRAGAPARGFILGYILFALVVLGIVTAVLSRINEAEADTKWVNDGVIRIKENLQTVRMQLITCSAILGASDAGGDVEFPPQPDPGTPTLLATLQCPQGAEPPIGLFDGSAGVFPPTPPRGFTPYVYVNNFNDYNAANGEEAVWVQTTVATPSGAAVLNRINLTAAGPDTEVATVDGVTRLRFYIARRADAGGGGS
jgi:hypothetical protein